MSVPVVPVPQPDALTRLYGRAVMGPYLDAALVAASESGARVAVFFVDLDDVKEFNSQYGFVAGDEALRVIAHRLDHRAGPDRQVTRFGGTDFVIVDPASRNRAEVVLLAHQVLHAVRAPFTEVELMTHAAAIAGRSITCSVGIGLSSPGITGDELLRQANEAMYSAKWWSRGVRRGSSYTVFDDRPPPWQAGTEQRSSGTDRPPATEPG